MFSDNKEIKLEINKKKNRTFINMGKLNNMLPVNGLPKKVKRKS